MSKSIEQMGREWAQDMWRHAQTTEKPGAFILPKRGNVAFDDAAASEWADLQAAQAEFDACRFDHNAERRERHREEEMRYHSERRP